MKLQETVRVAGFTIHISLEVTSESPVEIITSTKMLSELEETQVLSLDIRSDNNEHFYIDDLTFQWQLPATDMHGLYFGGYPRNELSYLPFWKFEKVVGAQTGLPFMAFIHRTSQVRAAFGLFDQLTETRLTAELSELTRCYHVTVRKPANRAENGQRIPVKGCWQEQLFVSRANVEWATALQAYAGMVNDLSAQETMPVPECAYDPVFCTWTAIHHDVSHDWIMKNAPIAAELGFRTWLTDDGWFSEGGRFADYTHVSDWLPSKTKFPDFVAHVKAVQELGFRYVLWVAPFMVGDDSAASRKYAHLLTTGQDRERFKNLSPWHSQTSEIIEELLLRLVSDYDIDGLKIDFIDALRIHSERLEGASEQTLGASIYATLSHVMDTIRANKPDFLVEFRNSYTNLASRRYANLYRSADVPINFTLNRWQAVLLRLLVPDRAVQMDPMLWHPEDTDENVAVHLINGIASVPMVSIEFEEYPASHIELIRYWIQFYTEHRNTIIHGDFKPQLQLGHIPAIYFVGTNETIVGLYDDVSVTLNRVTRCYWLLNASTRPYIEINGNTAGAYRVIEYDKFGKIVSEYMQTFPAGKMTVEVGGSLQVVHGN